MTKENGECILIDDVNYILPDSTLRNFRPQQIGESAFLNYYNINAERWIFGLCREMLGRVRGRATAAKKANPEEKED